MFKSAPETENISRANFRLGLFGDTRSGKTVYLTTMYWMSKHGRLPPEIVGLSPGDPESAGYLGERLAMIEAGQWPKGNIDSRPVTLLLSRRRDVLCLKTNDFKGGDFTTAFYREDGADNQRAEQFVVDLFTGCSAYIFLIDAGSIRLVTENPSDLGHQVRQERQAGAVETALEALRKRSHGLRLFHAPVAVIFTKADLHPECMAEPDAYARRHMLPTLNYLERHAPKQFKFFALTSTGELPPGEDRPPSPLRPSNGFFEPVLWCARMHAKRARRIKLTLLVVFAVIVACGYGVLFSSNQHRIAEVRDEMLQATDDQLASLYEGAKSWRGWTRFALTHQKEILPLCQEIVKAAEDRLAKSWANRLDDKENLRTVEDLQAVRTQVEEFGGRYAGTENAERLEVWVKNQRQRQAARIVEELQDAAKKGNERRFEELKKVYQGIALASLDADVTKAQQDLDDVLVHGMVRDLWYEFRREPGEIDRIRAQCQVAEAMIDNRHHPPAEKEFVQLVRKAYDRLHRGRTIELSYNLESVSYYSLKCWHEVDGIDNANESKFWKPDKVRDNYYRLAGDTFSIDLISTSSIRVSMEAHNWFVNGTASTPKLSPEQVTKHIGKKNAQEITTTRGDDYEVIFSTSDDERLSLHFRDMARLRELGKDLFGNAR